MLDKIRDYVISIMICTLFIFSVLLFAAAAQAQTVITDENNNVIRIENLEVTLDQGGRRFLDVDFVDDTAFNVYGVALDFPFSTEDTINVHLQVNLALNATNPVPTGAGPLGTNQHFIGADQDPLTGLIGAVGGQYIFPVGGVGEWDKCDTNCILGVAVQNPADSHTYAVFTLADSSGNQPPTADANGPHNGTAGAAITFDGMGSSDPDGSIVSYAWEFGDGNTGTGVAPSHTYNAADVYNVTLTVTDDSGATNSDATSASIGLGPQPPVADAGGTYTGEIGVAIMFDGTDSFDPDGSIATYDWDFGDGDTGTGASPSHVYSAGAGYDVTLTVTDDSGANAMDDTMAVIALGNLPPTADADGPYSGIAGVAVTFDGSGSSDPDGNIATYDWDFGDSTTGSGATPTHTYSADSIYNVTLTVTDDAGAADSDATAAAISSGNQSPVADANGPYTGAAGEVITFDGTGSSDPDGNIVAYDWDFGDGNTGTGATPTHTYGADDSYSVTLMVTDDIGATASDGTTASIGSVSLPPVADASGPYTGVTDVAVSFDGTGSTGGSSAPQMPTVLCGMDFATSTPCGAGDTNAIGILNLIVDGVLYDVEFRFDFGLDIFTTLPLTFINEQGAQAATIAVSDVLNTLPMVTTVDQQNFFGVPFEFEPVFGFTVRSGEYFPAANEWQPLMNSSLSPEPSSYADFTVVPLEPDASIVSYDWDFGDSNTGTGATPSHIYSSLGDYIVILTVTDDNGGRDSDKTSALIAVGNLPPRADANGPYTGVAGVAVTFDGSGSSDPDDGIASYRWDFGDSSTGSGATPSHVYADTGIYKVTLTVTDVAGATSSDGATAVIGSDNMRPMADAKGPYTGAVDVAVSFDGTGSSDIDGNIVTWEWDFGDASTGSGESTTHTYSASGIYYVSLTVTDDLGATDSNVTAVVVGTGNLLPLPDVGGPYTVAPGVAVTFDGTASSDPEGGALTYAWDFGDGNTGTGATPTNIYAAADVYRVTLTVTDDAGIPNSVDTVVLVRPESDLGIGQITVSPSPVLIDEPLTISIQIGNSGPNDEPAARATITLPANVAFSTATPSQGSCSESNGIVDCILGSIVNGGSVTISLTADAPSQTGPLAFGVTADGQNFDPNPDNVTNTININALAAVTVSGKAKGGGAFGMIGLLLLALATIPRLSRRIRQTSFAAFLSAGVLCGLMLGAPDISQAQDWYVGAGVGATDIDSDTSSFANDMTSLGHTVSNVIIDDSGEGWKVFGGYNINEYFAAEVAYVDLGDVTASFDGVSIDVPQMLTDAGRLLPATGDGFSISALGRYPFGERWAIFAEVGAFFWESDLAIDITGGSTTGSASPSTDGTDVVYGVGGDLYIGDNFGLRLEWERYALDSNDVDLVSASVLFRF